jgi:hypothetical protein
VSLTCTVDSLFNKPNTAFQSILVTDSLYLKTRLLNLAVWIIFLQLYNNLFLKRPMSVPYNTGKDPRWFGDERNATQQ